MFIKKIGWGFFLKKYISSRTPGRNWKKAISSSFFRKKMEKMEENKISRPNICFESNMTATNISIHSMYGIRAGSIPILQFQFQFQHFQILLFQLPLGPSTIARNTALARGRRAKQPEVGTDLPWRLAAHC